MYLLGRENIIETFTAIIVGLFITLPLLLAFLKAQFLDVSSESSIYQNIIFHIADRCRYSTYCFTICQTINL